MSDVILVYTPRNDWVLIKIEVADKVRGLYMPERSIEGKRYSVEALGPDVTDLEVGDWVLIAGQVNVDYAPVAGRPDLLVIKQSGVIMKITTAGEGDGQCSSTSPKTESGPPRAAAA